MVSSVVTSQRDPVGIFEPSYLLWELTNGEILYPDYNFRWLDYEGIIKRFGGHLKVYTQSLFLRYTVKRFKVLSAFFTTRNRNSITIYMGSKLNSRNSALNYY